MQQLPFVQAQLGYEFLKLSKERSENPGVARLYPSMQVFLQTQGIRFTGDNNKTLLDYRGTYENASPSVNAQQKVALESLPIADEAGCMRKLIVFEDGIFTIARKCRFAEDKNPRVRCQWGWKTLRGGCECPYVHTWHTQYFDKLSEHAHASVDAFHKQLGQWGQGRWHANSAGAAPKAKAGSKVLALYLEFGDIPMCPVGTYAKGQTLEINDLPIFVPQLFSQNSCQRMLEQGEDVDIARRTMRDAREKAKAAERAAKEAWNALKPWTNTSRTRSKT